jgi:bifunctional non-homologous end joining protein LigD
MRPQAEPASRHLHPASAKRVPGGGREVGPEPVAIPATREAVLEVGGRTVRLTNLDKPFWPERGITKRLLLQYYADIARWLLPHLHDRAMVMRRYPEGAGGPSFFMKRTPPGRPEWLESCAIAHASGNVIDFPMVQNLASLLWIVNLGCIDLNEWYARCDDVDRPDYLHFDLDPGAGVSFPTVREAALVLHEALETLGFPSLVKTSGSKGLHVYVPIVRGPIQHDVWSFTKAFAQTLAARHPTLLTAEYTVAKRPAGRVLVDYNQNAWGRTLASVYSVRPTPDATVSLPVTWDELEDGVETTDFRVDNVPGLLAARGDLWAPLLAPEGRVDLGRFL